MKKIYDAPVAELVGIDIDVVMQDFSIIKDDNEADGDFDANTNRNDWNNIWGEM